MALISNQLDSLYNGVNQQAAEHRLETQVEEMVNAYPTIDRGLLKRNPTTKLGTSEAVVFTNNMWSHEYDRGLSGNNEEKFTVNITDGSLEIINVLTGKVYKNSPELTFEDNSDDYLFPFSGSNGYAATTVKDTTFIVNKAMTPRKIDLYSGTTIYNAIVIDMKTIGVQPYAPNVPKTWTWESQSDYYGATTTITIDGINIVIDTPAVARPFLICFGGCPPPPGPETYASYSAAIFSSLISALGTVYSITYDANSDIIVTKLDGTAISGVYDIVPQAGTLLKTDYITQITNTTVTGDILTPQSVHLKTAYIWLKSANPASAYTYTVSITTEDEVTNKYSTSATTTTAAATALGTAIGANYTTTVVGSVIKIVSTNNIIACDASDTYGNQASFGWTHKVQSTTDLPKNIGFGGAVVKVTGSGDNTFASYWLQYSDSVWQETIDPSHNVDIDPSTMPHILVRNSDDTFTFKQYDGWANPIVGDIVSNPLPSFMKSEENASPVIKDIFFFKNRLGFITQRTIVMSEVGKYGNYWRTTTAAVLDSDHIDAAVDTTKVISLEYATYLEDSMLLFSDKAQFKLSGGRVLSPKDVQVAQTSAYDINISVRPIFMNDKVFFASNRGDYTAIMQYGIKSTNASSEAVDITAHVQSYIPSSVNRITGSSVNNMLFVTAESNRDTVYVYKYYDNGADRVQSAWFKWKYNGSIYGAFSLGRNLNLMIKRTASIAETDWVVGDGLWDNSSLWDDSLAWVMDNDSLTKVNQFETSQIFPQSHTGSFLDDSTNVDGGTIIHTRVDIGEWIASGRGGKDIRGHLKFKTVQISSEEGSEFNLTVSDIARDTSRTIKSKYTVGRKPMIYGDAKNVRVSIGNSLENGFRINTVSYEGSLTKRDTRR